MDRHRAFAPLLIALSCAATGASDLPLREARWTAGTRASLPYTLNAKPFDCSITRKMDRSLVAIGRVAFNDPLLLGGQASRAGLSCNSCHRNGRDNPAFFFPGLSGAPGTADVTSSLMSRKRGDGQTNPLRIPDLAAPEISNKVPRHKPGVLEAFVRGLIVEEFDGPEPSVKVLVGIAAFLRSQSARDCDKRAMTMHDVASDLRLYHEALSEARNLFRAGDRDTALAMLSGARSMLGKIDEYFALPGLESERALIGREADTVGAIISEIRSGRAGEWQLTDKGWPALVRALQTAQDKSFYNNDVIARELGVPKPIIVD